MTVAACRLTRAFAGGFRSMRDRLANVRRREAGNALVEFCYLGILFLVPLVYIMLAVFDVQRAAYAVSAAAREAGRAYVLAPSNAIGATRARQAAEFALRDQDIGINEVYYDLRCEPTPASCGQSGSTVVVTVRYVVSFPFLPDVLDDMRAATIPVTSVHRTPYGDFRESRS
jgi:hypothetical protein